MKTIDAISRGCGWEYYIQTGLGRFGVGVGVNARLVQVKMGVRGKGCEAFAQGGR